MSRQYIVFLVFGVALIGGLVFLFRPKPAPPTQWQGYAEADFVKVGPTQQGLLTLLHVGRGDRVAKGAPLFEQDETADRAALEQTEWQLAQAEAQLENLKTPGRPTEIAQAAANLADAEAGRDRIAQDLERNRSLLKTGAATAQIVDQEEADSRSAAAKIAASRASLEQLKLPIGRPEQITAQSAAVDAARAARAVAQWRLDQRHMTAPAAGVIADVMARPGETLAAGAPVVSLLPPGNIFVRFFIPEVGLAKVRIGDQVSLGCDNCPPDLAGRVSFIAPEAEYTPPFIFSETTRGKFVFLAEARFAASTTAPLNPGEPVTVRPIEAAPESAAHE